MTTTAHEDQFTAAPEPVREPMSREAILRRSVADLELALKQQTERAEAAEAELAKLAQQKPVVMLNLSHDGSDFEMFYDLSDLKFNSMRMPLYAAPVPAPHKGATHCDDCGLTWLDDGLNPLGCPYCKNHASERNARRYLALRKVGVHVPGYDFVKFDWSLDAAADRLLEGGE